MCSKKPLARAQSPTEASEGSAPPQVLSDEVISEILSWLPVKSLLRFRCVCKSWKSLISDPHFVKLHLQRSRSASNADFTRLRLMSQYTPYECHVRYGVSCSLRSLLDDPSSSHVEQRVYHRLKIKYRVLGCCNGLICLLAISFKEFWVRILNPATRSRSRKSPCFNYDFRDYRVDFYKSGFGYDHLSDTYKVVAVLSDGRDAENPQKTLVKIHSVGDDCWRDVQSVPAGPITRLNVGVGVYLSGTLNWLAPRDFGPGSGYEWDAVTIDRLGIVSLDLGTESYTQLLLPHIPGEITHVEPTLGFLRDCLCFSYDYKQTHFVVWQMLEFGVRDSWTQLLSISYQDLHPGCLEFPALIPSCMSDNGDILMLPKYSGSQAILCNLKDNELKHCQIPEGIGWMKAKIYYESLVAPCSRVS